MKIVQILAFSAQLFLANASSSRILAADPYKPYVPHHLSKTRIAGAFYRVVAEGAIWSQEDYLERRAQWEKGHPCWTPTNEWRTIEYNVESVVEYMMNDNCVDYGDDAEDYPSFMKYTIQPIQENCRGKPNSMGVNLRADGKPNFSECANTKPIRNQIDAELRYFRAPCQYWSRKVEDYKARCHSLSGLAKEWAHNMYQCLEDCDPTGADATKPCDKCSQFKAPVMVKPKTE